MAECGAGRRCRVRGAVALIFVVTGTQLPFPRLIGAMDALAPVLNEPVIAQVGPDTTPRAHIETHAKLPPAQFEALFGEARIVVAHAGVGSILSAKRLRRPLIVVPRRFDLNEHRNDHQQATAKELEGMTGIRIAWDLDMLPDLLRQDHIPPPDPEPGPLAESLVAHLRRFIDKTA